MRFTNARSLSGSHVALRMVKAYPDYLIIGFDSMEYCASLKNLAAIEKSPNFLFIKVRHRGRSADLSSR